MVVSEHKDDGLTFSEYMLPKNLAERLDRSKTPAYDLKNLPDADSSSLPKAIQDFSMSKEAHELLNLTATCLESSDPIDRAKGVRLYCYSRDSLEGSHCNFNDQERMEIALQSFYRDHHARFGYGMNGTAEQNKLITLYHNYGAIPDRQPVLSEASHEEKVSEQTSVGLKQSRKNQEIADPFLSRLLEKNSSLLTSHLDTLKTIPKDYERATTNSHLKDELGIAGDIHGVAMSQKDLLATTNVLLQSTIPAERLVGVRFFGYMLAKEGSGSSVFDTAIQVLANQPIGHVTTRFKSLENLPKSWSFTTQESMMIAFQYHYEKTNQVFEAPSGIFSKSLTMSAKEAYNRAIAIAH